MAKKWADGERNIRKRKGGCWEGRYTAGHDLEAGKPIYKNVLGRTQGEANPKAAIEEIKGLDVTMMGKYIVGAWMDKWFKNYAKIKVRSSSHHAYQGYIDNHIKPDIGEVPLEKLTSLELQKVCKKLLNSGRIDRVESKRAAQGSESQDGAEHLPGHRLSHEAGQGEKNYCNRSHRGLRPTEAGTSGDENIARRAVDLLSAGSQGERRLRDVLCGAGGKIEKRRIAWPQMGGN